MIKQVFSGILFLFIVHNLSAQDKNTPGTFNSLPLFKSETNGYFTYRIASMVTTKKGTLLAFAAARKGRGGGWDPINIVHIKQSSSGGSLEPAIHIISIWYDLSK